MLSLFLLCICIQSSALQCPPPQIKPSTPSPKNGIARRIIAAQQPGDDDVAIQDKFTKRISRHEVMMQQAQLQTLQSTTRDRTTSRSNSPTTHNRLPQALQTTTRAALEDLEDLPRPVGTTPDTNRIRSLLVHPKAAACRTWQ